ncbi:uncharacterized protein C11orf91 homolog [Pygocentrus nattereri]|uniref:Uncharacterized protein n=1 Tax=Pygocentrus nattereri TaxID=42514 RepID=A0A3B4DBI9_PYGNA|nr:uncharacterized protein C11orf91 homolog [Pygocentrus nattereri]XP_037395964.1 uncharacterized protein C11orf91 homolog [Pygocentrus nattereri]XP_037395966.1 uncharacterized protein C11orf91 homolog [Pygocentrus nattereri]
MKLKLHYDRKNRQPNMNIHLMGFFPSLYDTPHVVEDIWGSLCWNHGSDLSLFEPRPWPETSRLLEAEYRPLEFYSSPLGDAADPWSELDDICELYIRLKEIELLHQLGEEFDDRRYSFLSTVQYEKEKQMGLEEKRSVHEKKEKQIK